MLYDNVIESTKFIKGISNEVPEVGIILGSGLGGLIDQIEIHHSIDYASIPHFPISNVKGHAGRLILGKLGNRLVVVMQGRFHFYEGFTMTEVTYPLYVMKMLGVTELIITNACGGINTAFKPGDLMLIDDFINGVSFNPLRGANDERFGPRFPDMSDPYNSTLRERARLIAYDLKIPFKEGVYAFFQGPYYETRSEIKMYARLGADAIGMSTVPETIVANYLGMKVLGIACITNMATGLRIGNHSHDEVVAIASEAGATLCRWIEAFVAVG